MKESKTHSNMADLEKIERKDTVFRVLSLDS